MPNVVPVTPDDFAAATYIEQLRESTGMPKSELARRAELRRQTLLSYLAGQTAMTFGTVLKLAAILGVNAQDAVDGIEAVFASQNSEK